MRRAALHDGLLRHQAGAVVATVVDFSIMIALVSLAGASPALGTAFGAASGGVVNFLLGRRWIFRATSHGAAPQAGRYAMVSAGSLLLNTGAMHVLAGPLHHPFVAARVGVAVLVSVLWNFPMHRTFVFGARTR
ncbi:MAG TPA: GtrA family protein [Labilithrix sp.]|nr:GtrA family protein [Labilithrix sp.]